MKRFSSVIVTEDCVIIVDPCRLPHEVEEIKQYVEQFQVNRSLYLLFTHSDYDHIIGYQAFPEAKVITSASFANKKVEEKEAIIEEIKAFDDEYYITEIIKSSTRRSTFRLLTKKRASRSESRRN